MSQTTQPQPQASAGGPTIIVNQAGPGCLVRGFYFVFVGWWITGLWLLFAWFLNVTVVGLLLGITMLNRVPQVMTLSPGSQEMHMRTSGNITKVTMGPQQLPLWARALYFVLVGWWASLAWTVVAYLISLTIIGLPIAFLMFNLTGAITTLRRN